ncbi:Tn3 family transposase [Escherichia coli]|nr:Tn3 family transposase [Escherichia coli]EJU0899896.1 Tn3 family transposase [Escherichia coli]HAM9901726.1 transposase [Escherichia coli]
MSMNHTHLTDTAGFTDHIFALMYLLDFAFCPRIRDPSYRITKQQGTPNCLQQLSLSNG